ncbi:hypothetical protein [Pedobacter sp. SYP-B3415]|uniref:hypothetical protein n=1 Tax=Pedobacter sp. SYP-B3415 TaxID=2496641 RepID=UPI00101E2154|nr:hypothetical protein [Pedobacter sp. SYP-B3415]
MNRKIVSPKQHALIDYALTAAMLVLPSFLKMNKIVRKIYAAEAAVLLPYVALTSQPAAVKSIIPFRVHGRVDRFNLAHFAIQNLFPPFRRHRKELLFNTAVTLAAGLTILLTDWNGRTTK